MRIIKWLATGFEKKQPGVDIDLISSRCFNGLTVRWLYNLWFNLAFHFFSSFFTFRFISFSNKTMCTSMFISRLSSWGFFFPPIRIDLWRRRGGGDHMEWMCLGPGLQYVQMSAFTFLTYFHNTSRAFSFCQIQQWNIVRLSLYEYSLFSWGICWISESMIFHILVYRYCFSYLRWGFKCFLL